MTLLLVRHAIALPRSAWAGPDAARPLNERGRRQADGLVETLSPFPITRVLSSPAVRCVDTVEPTAAGRETKVEQADDLAEGAGLRALDLVRSILGAGSHLVLCTHGDVIGDVLDELTREGARLDEDARCQKGSTWVLDRDSKDRVVGRYLPPPG